MLDYGNCSQYDGICSVYLEQLTENNNSLATLSSSAITEELVIKFIEVLQTLVSDECSSVLATFICQYAYPPCDGNGSPLLITQEQCVNIRDDVCANEWRIVMATEEGSLLPVCEAFESESDSSSVVTRNISEPLRCHHHFREYCGICLPLCRTFSQYSDEDIKFGAITLASYITLSLSGAIILLIAAIVKRKSM